MIQRGIFHLGKEPYSECDLRFSTLINIFNWNRLNILMEIKSLKKSAHTNNKYVNKRKSLVNINKTALLKSRTSKRNAREHESSSGACSTATSSASVEYKTCSFENLTLPNLCQIVVTMKIKGNIRSQWIGVNLHETKGLRCKTSSSSDTIYTYHECARPSMLSSSSSVVLDRLIGLTSTAFRDASTALSDHMSILFLEYI